MQYTRHETLDVFAEVLGAATTTGEKKSLCQFSEYFSGFEPWKYIARHSHSFSTLVKIVCKRCELLGIRICCDGSFNGNWHRNIVLCVSKYALASKMSDNMNISTMNWNGMERAWFNFILVDDKLNYCWLDKLVRFPHTCDSSLAFAYCFTRLIKLCHCIKQVLIHFVNFSESGLMISRVEERAHTIQGSERIEIPFGYFELYMLGIK